MQTLALTRETKQRLRRSRMCPLLSCYPPRDSDNPFTMKTKVTIERPLGIPVFRGRSHNSERAYTPGDAGTPSSADTVESVPYILQNLKAVYGTPKPQPGLDPLDVLIETILSQSTSNVNSDRAFESLKRRFPNL